MVKKRSLSIALASVVAVTSMCLMMGMRDVKAQSMDDLMKRIEALEARSTGNVTAPKIRGLKIGFEIRHRFEQQVQFPTGSGTGYSKTIGSATIGTSGGVRTLDGLAGNAEQGRKVDNEFTLQRIRLSFDADVNKNVRGFIKLQDSRTFGAEQSTIGDLTRVDLLEAYAELRNLGDISPVLNNVELRIGRWQAAYGNHRLIGTLNWVNVGRSYDGARLRWDNKKNAWIDVFAYSVQESATGGASGDDGPTSGVTNIDTLPNFGTGRDEVLYGVYSQFRPYEGNVFEPYLLARARSNDIDKDNDKGGAALKGPTEQRYTAGFRLDGRNIPGLGGLDYTFEPAWQFGKVDSPSNRGVAGINKSEDIQAFAIYAGGGYTFKDVAWTPRIGYAYVFASGDDRPGEGAAKTFDQLYPTGHAQLGYIDFAAWQNIADHQIHFSVKPTKKLVVDAKLHFFSLDEEADAWYSVGGGTGFGGGLGVIRAGADLFVDPKTGVTSSVDDDLGQEIDLTVKYKLFKNFGVVAGYSHFFSGDFIEDTGADIDRGADWMYLMTTLKF
jgi:Alginate export